MADTSLWPVVVGGLLTGLFALGGIGVGLVGTACREAALERREARKRRADKFEELVAAVYEYDHWLDSSDRERDASGFVQTRNTVSPFAKVQSISSVYFPQFSELIGMLDFATHEYIVWIYASPKLGPGDVEASAPYMRAREELLDALKNFAHAEFQ
jgi:hypothetical protein